MKNVIMDRAAKAREAIVKKFGTMDRLFEHLVQMDAERAARMSRRRPRTTKKPAKKKSTR